MSVGFKDLLILHMINMLINVFGMRSDIAKNITTAAKSPWSTSYDETDDGGYKITVHCGGTPASILSSGPPPASFLSIKYIMLTLLFEPKLMGRKPRIIVCDHGKQPRFAYLEDDTLWTYHCFTFWDKISYAHYLNEDTMASIMSDVIKYFPPTRFVEILEDIHPDYRKILFGDKNDQTQYIEDSKVNLENRMILIRFLNEHFGGSDPEQMRL